MTSVKEQQLAELVKCVHEIRQSFLYLILRIRRSGEQLEHLRVEHLLYAGLCSLLYSFHIPGILLCELLKIPLCYGRRILRYL